MWRVAIPVLVIMLVGLQAHQHMRVDEARPAATTGAAAGPGSSFGGEFIHPVYTPQPEPEGRRVLM